VAVVHTGEHPRERSAVLQIGRTFACERVRDAADACITNVPLMRNATKHREPTTVYGRITREKGNKENIF